ncbi:oligosaccharide flippase family protein [Eudoraea chungangensis]|uniref:oligosaccharide flippase family protein n=1 Tax=Eudoraea chungangensis TaxID=1481905 RepID=UPI0023EB60F1|nr:oligosaccharide flippase family protein [Eudoraea chungangensis]
MTLFDFSTSDFFKKVIQGTFWISIGSILSKGLLFFASIILARILSILEYGEYSMVKSTIDSFLVFASMGIGLTTTKYISELKDFDKENTSSLIGAAISLVLILSILIATLVIVFSKDITIRLLNNSSIQIPLIIGSFSLVFIAINSTQMGALLGMQSYKQTSISNLIRGVLMFFGLCVGGYLYGVTGALTGNLIALVLVTFVLQALLRSEAKKIDVFINLENWKSSVKKIYKFALPASLSSIIIAPSIWILNTILVNQTNGYEELGLFNAVLIFILAIQMFNGSINEVLLPLFLSRTEKLSVNAEFFNYYGPWIISIILSLPLIIYPEIILLILGSKYDDGLVTAILSICILYTLITSSKGGISRDLIMKNKMWLSVLSMGQCYMTILIAFYFLKDHGAIGLALSFLIGFVTNYILFLPFFIQKKISPSHIFYNRWVWIVWGIILTLITVNQITFIGYVYRIFITTFLVISLFLAIVFLYKKTTKEAL